MFCVISQMIKWIEGSKLFSDQTISQLDFEAIFWLPAVIADEETFQDRMRRILLKADEQIRYSVIVSKNK
jgi:hypothetical protein